MLWIHFPFFLSGKAGISVALFSVHEPWPAETDPRAGRVLRMWDSELRLWTQQKRGGHSSQVCSVFIVYRKRASHDFYACYFLFENRAKICVKIKLRFLHEIHACYFSSLSHAKNSHELHVNFIWHLCKPLLPVYQLKIQIIKVSASQCKAKASENLANHFCCR